MKILVYTLGIPLNHTFTKRKEILDKKKADLKVEYPSLNVMVIPGPENEGDKVFVADMTYYGPSYTTSPIHPGYYGTSIGGAGVPGGSGGGFASVTGTGGGGSGGGPGKMYTMTVPMPPTGPVTTTTANVVHYMDDHSMFKMDQGPSGFDFVNTGCDNGAITGTTSHDANPLGENVVDFKPK